MKRRQLLLGGLAAPVTTILGCGGQTAIGSPSAEAPASGTVESPLQFESPHLSVTVNVNGTPLRFVLDTGADGNVVTARAAAALGLPVSVDTLPGAGSGGPVEVRWTRISDLAIGAARLRNEVAYVVPAPETFPWDGAIGAPFFRAFVPRFDYAARMLRLTLASRFSAPAGVVRLPAQMANNGNRMLVQARMAGHEGWFAVDTGAFNAVTVHTPSVERLGLRGLGLPMVRMITGEGAGGLTRGDIVRLPELQLGPWRLTQVVAELSLQTAGAFADDAWMGNLGSELFRRFGVTFDMAGSALYLEPNGALAEAFPGPRSGLYLQWTNGHAEAVEVLPAGPAALTGLAPHDVVLSLDGQTLEPGRWAQQVMRLKQPNGTRVSVKFRTLGSAIAREGEIVLRDLV
jgi:predicted aspartyl protease